MSKRKPGGDDTAEHTGNENLVQGSTESVTPAATAESVEPGSPFVTGVRVRALGQHEHNGTLRQAGAEFTMSPEAAELAVGRGDIEVLGFNEEVHTQ